MNVPNPIKIVGSAVYADGLSMVGSVEFTIPDMMFLKEEVDSLASAGAYDMILPKMEKMETEVKANGPGSIMAKAAFQMNSNLILDARGTYQVDDPASGVSVVSDKIVMHVRGAGLAMGTQANSSGGERAAKFVVNEIIYYVDGVEVLHFATGAKNILVVNGVDLMSTHRRNLGN